MKYLFLLFFLVSLGGKAQEVNPNGFNIFKYPNGQKSAEGFLRDGQPDGKWKNYYVSGKIKSIVFRKDFLLDSTCIFFTEKGDTTERINYAYGKKNGYYYTFQPSNDSLKNIPIIKELFVNDIRQQWAYYYHENGKLKQKVFYKNGEKQGESKLYDTTGNVCAIYKYLNDRLYDTEKINRTDRSGQKQGIWREYWPNDNIHKESFYRNNLLDGYYKEFNENGKQTLAIRYEKGIAQSDSLPDKKKIEVKITYAENGKIKETGGYKEDKPVGTHKIFDDSGNPKEAIIYSNDGIKTAEGSIDTSGGRNGKWIFYYEDGQIRSKGFYKKNMKQGEWTYFHPNGKPEQNGEYEQGLPTGTWKWYYETGELLRDEEYADGVRNGLMTEYAKNNTILSKGKYANDLKDGEWFYLVGDHLEKGSYKNGQRIGNWIYYYTNGKIMFQGEFTRDLENGKQKYFYPKGNIRLEGKCAMGKRVKTWNWYDENGFISMSITYESDKETKIDGKRLK